MTFCGAFEKTAVSNKSFREILKYMKSNGRKVTPAIKKLNTKAKYEKFVRRLYKEDPKKARSVMSWLRGMRTRAWKANRESAIRDRISEGVRNSWARRPRKSDGRLGLAVMLGVPVAAGLYALAKRSRQASTQASNNT